MLILLDLIINNICNITLISYIIYFYYLTPTDFIYSLLIFILFNNNIFMLLLLIMIYLTETIIKRFTNYNLLMRLLPITIYYFLISTDIKSYVINILLVIILHYLKYNSLGDNIGIKKISR